MKFDVASLLGVGNVVAIETGSIVKLLIFFAVVTWLALVFFTYSDARRRIADQVLVSTAAAAALFLPFVGTLIYMIVRPSEYLADVRERELEMQAAEATLIHAGVQLCPKCSSHVRSEWVRCPSCTSKLRDRCSGCSGTIEPEWKVCPICETSTPVRELSQRRRPGASDSQPEKNDSQKPDARRRSTGPVRRLEDRPEQSGSDSTPSRPRTASSRPSPRGSEQSDRPNRSER